MNILVINGKEGKNNKDALELLKANGFDVYIEDALTVFYNDEAEYRTDRLVGEEDDLSEKFNSLTEEQKQEVYGEVSQTYCDEDGALDYDWLDDKVREGIESVYNKYN